MRLIDADVMIEYLRKLLCDNCSEKKDWCDVCDYAYLIDEMKKVPTVDPYKHGHWEWNDYGGFGNYHCTACRHIPYGKFPRKYRPDYMYCPHCGAKMDERREDGNS